MSYTYTSQGTVRLITTDPSVRNLKGTLLFPNSTWFCVKKRIGETFVLNFETAARLTLVVLICNQYTFSDIQKKSAHTLHLLFFWGWGWGGEGGRVVGLD